MRQLQKVHDVLLNFCELKVFGYSHSFIPRVYARTYSISSHMSYTFTDQVHVSAYLNINPACASVQS